jgi:hypothetical protein
MTSRSRFAAASRRTAKFCSTMHDPALAQSPIEQAPWLIAPARDLLDREDENVGGNAQRPEQPPEPHHLPSAVFDPRPNDQEIQVGVLARVTAGMRPEEDDASGAASLREDAHRRVDLLAGHHVSQYIPMPMLAFLLMGIHSPATARQQVVEVARKLPFPDHPPKVFSLFCRLETGKARRRYSPAGESLAPTPVR